MKFNIRQKKVIDAKENKIICLATAASGKSLPNSTIIPTPDGQKKVGEVKVGDYLFDRNGQPTKVLGIYPQGMQTVYEITLSDGRKTLCSKDHIWCVHNNLLEEKTFQNLTLEEIIKRGYRFNTMKGKIYAYSIPCIKEVHYNSSEELPESPYLMGKSLSGVKDKDIIRQKDSGVFIPNRFKYSSVKNRKDLIRGFLSVTESYIDFSKDKTILQFIINSKRLAKDLLEVFGSLGVAGYLSSKDQEPAITLVIDRNASHYKELWCGGNKVESVVDIVEIKNLHRLEEMTCFYVENEEHLFLTNDFIVTHNTATLTERVRKILEDGCPPSKVACITFTTMAADEMRERLGTRSDGVFIGTIHSLANSFCALNNVDTTKDILDGKFDIILKKALTIPKKSIPVYEHIFVDEFQDISELEYNFIQHIPTNNIFLTGDERQMIYGFKGNSDKFLRNLYNDEEYTTYFLKDNYRNPPNIIKFADDLISTMEKISPSSEPTKKFKGHIEKCSFSTALEELEWSQDWTNWYIICRTNTEVDKAMEILDKREIPYVSFKRGDVDLEGMNLLLKENRVKVLTIHAMKGLEGKNVIVVGARMYNEDERKISYVAATRAESSLYWCPSIARRSKGAAPKGQNLFEKFSQDMVEF